MKDKKYKFIVGGGCINEDCICKQYDNLISNEKGIKIQPPLHENCHCYFIPWNDEEEEREY